LCHVLIIEDDPLVAMSVQALLADHGATSFDLADTEAGAIVAAREKRPAIIVSDVTLRVGTGPAAVKAIHAFHGEIPVIFVTGTPEACDPVDPPGRLFAKPMHEPSVVLAFREMTAG